MAVAMIENNIEPLPSNLREFLINLMPIAKTATVIAISTRDMPTMATPYNISKNDAVKEWSVFKT